MRELRVRDLRRVPFPLLVVLLLAYLIVLLGAFYLLHFLLTLPLPPR